MGCGVVCQVYSVLGLLMVSTYNYGLGRKRLYDRQVHGWLTTNNPTLSGSELGDLSLPGPQSVPTYKYDIDMAEKNYLDDFLELTFKTV